MACTAPARAAGTTGSQRRGAGRYAVTHCTRSAALLSRALTGARPRSTVACSLGPINTWPYSLPTSTSPLNTATVVLPLSSTLTSQSVPRMPMVAVEVLTCRWVGWLKCVVARRAPVKTCLAWAHMRPRNSSKPVCCSSPATLWIWNTLSWFSRTWVWSRISSAVWLASPVRTKLPALTFCRTDAVFQPASVVSRTSTLPSDRTISASLAQAQGARGRSSAVASRRTDRAIAVGLFFKTGSPFGRVTSV